MLIDPDGHLGSGWRAIVASHADRPALRFNGQTTTYAEVDEASRAVAAALTTPIHETAGATPLVAVVLEASVEFVCTVLGVVRSGAAYLPLDVDMPDDYLLDVLRQAKPAVVVTTADRAAPLRACGALVVTYDALASTPTAPPAGVTPTGGNPAYVIYTSGSTGRPKGVVVSHRALLNSTAARTVAYGIPERVPLVHSVAFDLASGVLWWALLSGGTLVVSDARLRDVGATLALVHDEQITHLVYAASLYAPFLQRAAAAPPTGLVAVMIGSERWSEVLIDRHAQLLPATSLYNEYGPTEACVWSSYAHVYDGQTGRRAPLTLGQPIINTGYLVLDDAGNPVRSGDQGELCITGSNLALGYLHQPELTAQRFVQIDGQRAYRTGDLVEVTDSGECVFLGRVDRQVKVGGNRVEAGHVETVLMSHSGVVQAYVRAATAGRGVVLVAYLVAEPGGGDREGWDTAGLDAYLSERLPAYMKPSAYVVVDELPRTPSGKVDESRLPEPVASAGDSADEVASPLESSLAVEVADILGRSAVGVVTPLTQVGANSLAFVQIAATISSRYGVEVPISAMFADPTVRAIAAHVRVAVPGSRPPLVVAPQCHGPAPLSAQQQQIWVLHQLAPLSLAYNAQCSLRLTGPLDVPALEAALSTIVERHEILRTTFHDGPDGPVQVVHEPWPVCVDVVDLTHVGEALGVAALAAEVDRQTRRRFDVSALPLVRWHLYRLSPTSFSLLQVEHHFVHDGWSAVLWLREIREVYRTAVEGRQPDLAPLPVQYRDYARWYQEWTTTEDFAQQGRFWQRTLDGCPVEGVTFQPDQPRPQRRAFRGSCLRAEIPAATVASVDALCAQDQVSRFAVFLAAFASLVWRHTDEADLVIGSALSNRRLPNTAPMMGMFVNALPLRLSIAGDRTVVQVVADTMQTILQAQDHQEFPLVEIVRRLGLPRDASRNPLFSLMFAFHDSPRPRFEVDDLRGELVIEHNGSAKNDLNVVCVPHPPEAGSGLSHGGMQVLWEYDEELFDRATAQALLTNFGHVLDVMIESWNQRLDALDLLGPDQTATILRAGTGAQVAVAHPTLHGGADASIARQPDVTAVVQGDREVTYQDLDQLSTHLEQQLAEHGVGAGAVVAIAVPRSPELVAACLAVLRRGAVYLCLDDQQPPARVDLLVADAQPVALVCTAATAAGLRRLDVPLIVADRPDVEHVAAPARPQVDPQSAAYLVYTSGSTGTPKAVLATHGNAAAAIQARTALVGAAAPRTLVTLPPIFDVATSVIFWTLALGGTVVFPPSEDETRDPDALRHLVEQHAVTHLNMVPSFYRHLVGGPDGWGRSLRLVAVGGEPCPLDLVVGHAAHLPHAILLNEYGPTETTAFNSATRLYDPQTQSAVSRISVGRPVANASMFVLDLQRRLAPLGGAGELHIGGAGVAAGYHQRPGLTLDRFVIAQGGPLAGTRLYRTGDRARLNHRGEFEILGRLDEQVKLRGYRIELGEVRRCLIRHPQVDDAFVLLQQPSDGPGRLLAYVASDQPADYLMTQLPGWVADRLPSYMVPASHTVLPELPRTSTGKIDPSRLPPPHEHAESAPPGRAVTDREARLITLVRDVLGTSASPGDDFFALGGDSLQAIRLATRARAHGMRLTAAQVLQARTVNAIAALMVGAAAGTTAVRRLPGTAIGLTPIQGWFFAQRFANPHHFNQARLYQIAPDTPQPAMLEALAWTIARHDAFRTRFRRDGRTWAAFLDDDPVRVEQRVLSGPAEQLLAQELNELQRSLNIEHGPLFRIVVFTMPGSPQRWLYLVAHHLIVDSVSWDILGEDIESACRRLALGERLPDQPAPGLPELSPAAAPSDTELGYWRGLLDQPKPTGGADRLAEPVPVGQLRHASRRLTPHATRHLLHDAPRLYSSTTESILLAALAQALGPLSDRPGLYTFVERHGRDGDLPADGVVGWLTNLYPVLLSPPQRDGLLAWAAAFGQQLAQVPAGGATFGRARYLEPDSSLGTLVSKLDLPRITVNYLGQAASVNGRGVLRSSPLDTGQAISPSNVLPTPLHITFAVDRGTLQARFSYDEGVWADTIESVADRFVASLEHTARAVPLTDRWYDASAQPHWLVHPIGGAVDWYAPLARTLAPQQNCYGLPYDRDDNAPDIPMLAAAYLDRIHSVQPAGPYRLTGWSFGAVIAYEIARQLEQDGQSVRLTLLDPVVPFDRAGDAAALVAQVSGLTPHLNPSTLVTAVDTTRNLPPLARAQVLAEQLGLTGPEPEHTLAQQRLDIIVRNHAALTAWRPEGSVHNLLLILSAQTAARQMEALAGWQDLARMCVNVEVVPGDHQTMLTGPGLKKIEEHLRAPLRDPHGEGR
ncbi:non-ribosomal peptide synthetase [Micromonospora sp. WMMD1082]|uniref:amino acid adenylation domain-containing protein n=1 Tax=Micromonospora sp. WMMD1082 TaxID=3016104 RepID=UPI00241626C3|nr:non-ribosomal peptide synthetase [Micromonospora sp. WMMD1082]MDG4795133.1 amino acid adenylation domain-containing protein [Micromonospora sp. WMMD1082]